MRYKRFYGKTQQRYRILDVGCGSGVFCFVCNALKHDAQGLEMPIDSHQRVELNAALSQWFGVTLIHHLIEPMERLPLPDGRFDHVTAFSPQFYRIDRNYFWSREVWEFWFDELKRICSDDATFMLKLNLSKAVRDKSEVYDHSDFCAALSRYRGVSQVGPSHYRIDLNSARSLRQL
jgi:SAM-dependent methyltransferase